MSAAPAGSKRSAGALSGFERGPPAALLVIQPRSSWPDQPAMRSRSSPAYRPSSAPFAFCWIRLITRRRIAHSSGSAPALCPVGSTPGAGATIDPCSTSRRDNPRRMRGVRSNPAHHLLRRPQVRALCRGRRQALGRSRASVRSGAEIYLPGLRPSGRRHPAVVRARAHGDRLGRSTAIASLVRDPAPGASTIVPLAFQTRNVLFLKWR